MNRDEQGGLIVALRALLTLAVVHTLWVLAGAPAGEHRPLIANLAFLPIYGLAAFLAFQAARARGSQLPRRAWLLIASGLSVWTVAQVLYTYLDLAGDEPIFPSIADVGFIALAPLCAVGVLMYSDQRLNRRQVVPFTLDVLIVTVTVVGLLWGSGMSSANHASPLQLLTLYAYSLTDVLLLATLLVMALWHPNNPARNFVGVLAMALLLLVLTHFGMSPLLSSGTYYAGHPIDALWSWSAGLFGLAAYRSLRPGERAGQITVTLPHQHRALLSTQVLHALPLLAIVITMAREAVHHTTGTATAFTEWTTSMVVSLVLARLFVSEHLNRQLNQKLVEHAYHDHLTGLPNRAALLASLPLLANHARTHDTRLAVMFIDLDRFKPVNDLLGHTAGDQVLAEACERVAREVCTVDLVTRVGGDELIVVLPAVTELTTVTAVAQRVLQSLARPFTIAEHTVTLSASIGISVYPTDTGDVFNAVAYADLAMYQAKQQGKNTFRYYNEALHAQSSERFSIATLLPGALERAELQVCYQPIIELQRGRVYAFEALLRWNHPNLGIVPPTKFIPIAEEDGFIHCIGEWVLNEVARQVGVWRAEGREDVLVSLNVSAVQFMRDDFVACVTETLGRNGIPGSSILLELTESALIQDVAATNEKLLNLRGTGVRIALDDFGTGYSSLSYLQRLDVDVVKVDQSFIRSPDERSRTLVRAVARVAGELGLKVIAEGVETQAQMRQAARHGFDAAQGYYFAPPLTCDEASELLRGHHGPLAVKVSTTT